MHDMETELQYLYRGDDPPLVPTELAGLALAGSRRSQLVDTYYDTELLELRRAGCTLRVRQVEDTTLPSLTWKGKAGRRQGAKVRHETEIPLERLPESAEALTATLRRLDIWPVVRKSTGLGGDARIAEIGKLWNERSTHAYVRGLHRLDLMWDRLHYPSGPDEVRLEVEVRSRQARRLVQAAGTTLGPLFNGNLVRPDRGKVSELCHRLYPDLVGD